MANQHGRYIAFSRNHCTTSTCNESGWGIRRETFSTSDSWSSNTWTKATESMYAFSFVDLRMSLPRKQHLIAQPLYGYLLSSMRTSSHNFCIAYLLSERHGEAGDEIYSMVPFRAPTWTPGLYLGVGSFFETTNPEGYVRCSFCDTNSAASHNLRHTHHRRHVLA
jgi:hypothetical protein